MRSASYYLAPLFFLGGCSLINSFDDVKGAVAPGSGGNANGSGGDNGNGGSSPGGGGGASGGAAAGGLGGATGGKGGGGGGGGLPNDGGTDGPFVTGTNGAIVAYAFDQPKAGTVQPPARLVVIAPTDGTELSFEKIGTVKGIVNDGITDTWYIFEAGATPTDKLKLHVRKLRTTDGQWLEIGTASQLPAVASRVVALNGRLAYLSTTTPLSPDPATLELTLLNTEDPKNVSVVAGTPRTLPPGRKQTLVGEPGGQTVDTVSFSACATGDAGLGECDVALTSFSVQGTSLTQGASKVVGKTRDSGNVALEYDTANKFVVVAFPAIVEPTDPSCSDPLTAPTSGSVQKFRPTDFVGVGQAPVSYKIVSQQISGAAFDPCFNEMFVTTQLYDTAVWAIPLAPGGVTQKICRGGGGASMLFESHTRTLIRATTGGNAPEFFRLVGSAAAPHLNDALPLPNLPPAFRPIIMAVRQTPSTSCPN